MYFEVLLRLENLNEKENVTVVPDVINILKPKTFEKCQVVNLIGQEPTIDFQETVFHHHQRL